jgi:hypothetical protein
MALKAPFALVCGFAASLAWVPACGRISLGSNPAGPSSDAGDAASSGGGLTGNLGLELSTHAVDKVDLLFMIDNSESMGQKQALLAQAFPDLIARLVTPNCVDSMGAVLGRADMNGQCAAGRPEFPAVHDMHLGIVTSSLGGHGGNQCPPDAMNEADHTLLAHYDDQGHLINRSGDGKESPVPNAGSPNQNFLAWYPPVAANKSSTSNPPPPVPPETMIGAPGMPGTLIGDFTEMIAGVNEHGCGYPAQNEAWYRFLVQPEPFDHISINGNQASLVGVDTVILQQRNAFLRPDSLLAIIVLGDENEKVGNPLSVSGEGWLYESLPFPGSPNYGAPEGTIECAAAPGLMSGPNDPNCTSCGFATVQIDPNFAARCPNDGAKGVQGFLDPVDDGLRVRFFHQKQRFGVFFGYPVTRYTRGLMSPTVPDRSREVDSNGNYIGDQDSSANCVNPIFAQNLPRDPSGDLCHLQRGPRTPDLVFYAAIAGVPHQLLQAQPGDAECPAGTSAADCPQKSVLSDSDWLGITGNDPEHYDFAGADFHMIESETPRAPANCGPTSAADNCDPINGREWDTGKNDLQFACIFPLVDPATGMPAPRDCTDPKYTGACDCAAGSNSQNTPLCLKNGSAYTTTQTYGKAYPSVRAMEIAHAMAASPSGNQGIVSSVCPIHTSFVGGPTDPLYGYRPAANAIANRVKRGLAGQCFPRMLARDPTTGSVNCHLLVTLPRPGAEDICLTLAGLSIPDATFLGSFRPAQKAAWNPASGLPDPSTLPVCEMAQLTPQRDRGAFGPDGTCGSSTTPGWCYVEGQVAGACPQQILFTPSEPPSGATLNLLCQ